jgi:hypothetical protein
MSSSSCLCRPSNRQFSSSAAQALTPAAGLTEAYAAGMPDRTRAARVEDVHRLAMEMPHVTVTGGTKDNPVYQVGGKSFIFFRNPRPDAIDPDSGGRYRDVIVFWVADEAEKQALIQDKSTPFFSTAHFDGHPSVLGASRLGGLSFGGAAGNRPRRVAREGVTGPCRAVADQPSGQRYALRRPRIQRLTLLTECVVDGGASTRLSLRARPRPGPSPGGGDRRAPQYRQPTGCPAAPTTRSHPPQPAGPPEVKHRDWPGRGPKRLCPACRSRTPRSPPHLAARLERRPTRSAETPRQRRRSPDRPGQPDHLRHPMPGGERWVGPLQHRHPRPWSSFDPIRHPSRPLLDRRH